MKKICTIVISIFLSLSLFAQQDSSHWDKLGWRFGLFGGPSFFAGDVSSKESDLLKDMGYHGGVSVQKYLCPHLDMRVTAWFGPLHGTKENNESGESADLHFDGKEFNYSLALQYDFLRAIGNPSAPFSMYATAGVARNNFSATLKKNSTKATISDTTATCVVIPVGIGFNYHHNEHWDFNLECAMNLATSDAIDGCVSNGNNKTLRDMYATISLGFTYTFIPREYETIPTVTQETTPIIDADTTQTDSIEVSETEFIFEEEEAIPEKIETPIIEETVVKQQIETPVENPDDKIVPGLIYRFQILAIQDKNGDKLAYLKEEYPFLTDIHEEIDATDGMQKFYIEKSVNTMHEAYAYRDSLRKQKVRNCFIVPFYYGKRIPNQQARDLRGEK